ncbi:putative ABC-class ATPase [Desulfohalotomaculum tongense]|uniref:ABC-ATPase domain-containing protein n=1 Tax=Desulforadius tongensis TaxID=1216062 RepID=UPI0019574037|nr:ABC-ATPase domain-containing protein [Desulforadius tongensis]MBM7855378.1 putative ABC-class ATPase [Desulforadius tongensis]
MFTDRDLKSKLSSIDGRGYKAYKSIAGMYRFPHFQLFIDHVQSDPFAPPSRIRVRVPQDMAGFPGHLFKNYHRRAALQDYLTRQFARSISVISQGKTGSGKSGIISIDRCGQEILERTAMVVNDRFVEARLAIGLPARGRTIMAKEAISIFFDQMSEIVSRSLYYKNLHQKQLQRHIELVEDQAYLQSKLLEQGLVAFVANGSILPRESGVSDKPLTGKNVIPFRAPKSLEVTFELPNNGRVTGMGIPKGVTLIVGGGYHGKSTLLRAIERGVYHHIPGDGREFVVTVPDAVKIRAEDGRSVQGVNISGFINNLPFQQDTEKFSTENASGSTSQAANIVEALEVGTSLLLLDEDTSATNFMIRDGRMQKLVSKEQEPITPFIDRVRELYDKYAVSSILVVGGSGDYFTVADCVIKMENYTVKDVTKEAKEIAAQSMDTRRREVSNEFSITRRIFNPAGFKLNNRDKVKARGLYQIQYGRKDINLHYVEQLVDDSQTNAIAEIIRYAAKHYFNGKLTLAEVVDSVLNDIKQFGLDVISPFKGQHPGNLALPRKHEICSAINRMRGVETL